MVRSARLIAILAVVLGAAFSISGPAQAGGHGSKLSAAVQGHIRSAAHRYLRKVCSDGLQAPELGIRTRTPNGRHLIVAQTTCAGATATTPIDTGVYTKRGRERYLLDRGRAFAYGKRTLIALSAHKVRRGVVAVVYGGYAPDDMSCCPSRMYERVFHVHWSHATHGRLHRVSLR